MSSSMVKWHSGSDHGRDSKRPDMDLSNDRRAQSIASNSTSMGPAVASES